MGKKHNPPLAFGQGWSNPERLNPLKTGSTELRNSDWIEASNKTMSQTYREDSTAGTVLETSQTMTWTLSNISGETLKMAAQTVHTQPWLSFGGFVKKRFENLCSQTLKRLDAVTAAIGAST